MPYECPKCHSHNIRILVETWATQTADQGGFDDLGDMEFDDDSLAYCLDCHFGEGTGPLIFDKAVEDFIDVSRDDEPKTFAP